MNWAIMAKVIMKIKLNGDNPGGGQEHIVAKDGPVIAEVPMIIFQKN